MNSPERLLAEPERLRFDAALPLRDRERERERDRETRYEKKHLKIKSHEFHSEYCSRSSTEATDFISHA